MKYLIIALMLAGCDTSVNSTWHESMNNQCKHHGGYEHGRVNTRTGAACFNVKCNDGISLSYCSDEVEAERLNKLKDK